MTLEEAIYAKSEATGAPYGELYCLVRSCTRGCSVRVDEARREFVITAQGGEKRWPFGWLGDGAGERGGE